MWGSLARRLAGLRRRGTSTSEQQDDFSVRRDA